METKEIYCCVHGRVQLVMFRDFVRRKARNLDLIGYVRNKPDSTVEVIAQGSRDNLEKLIAHMHRGSLLAHVDRVEVEWREPHSHFTSFDIVF